MNLKKMFSISIVIMSLSVLCLYAIPANINTGNPTVPFPQFLSYAGADSIALYNPVGVPHAEMEQWIRDAYQIMANSFYDMGTVTYGSAVIPVYKFTAMLQPYFCAEGHGYALLAAAIMGDKAAFDGLWFYLNENNYFLNTLKYSTGVYVPRGKAYGKHIVSDTAGDSAADGDFDIAMAAYIAWKQWGDGTGYFALGGTGAAGPGGFEIQYKQMALDMIKFLVEKDEGDVNADPLYTTGDIGWDGYIKGGNTWKEMTNWADSYSPGPQFNGSTKEHIDYAAPAYFHCFHHVAQAQGLPLWDISQYARAEASSDWMMGQVHSKGWLPTAGWVSMNIDGTGFNVTNFLDGEDYRNPMRTHLNWLWNGPPDVSWNPVTHLTSTASNTYEKDSAIDLINFLKDERVRLGAGAGCKSTAGSMSLSFWGIPTTNWQYNPVSGAPNTFHLNMQMGTASAAALIYGKANANDYSVAAQIFRELTMEWDTPDTTQQYINSVPKYMHEFMRLWGMLILTGNLMSGCDMAASANMKIYKAINKTYGFPGDKITYWLNIRNYGSLDATGVTVTDQLDGDFSYDSSTPAGSFNAGTNTVTWSFPTVNGFKTGLLNNTMRGITVVAQVKSGASGRYCNIASVACANGTGWTSNEYPNNQTDVMERNCIDIVAAALTISKTADVASVNPLNTVTYTIAYCNTSKAGWLNGGRPGVVVCYANEGISDTLATLGLKFRLFHDADEPWINYKNYRISYFLNDGSRKTISQTMNTADWWLQKTIYEGGDFNGVTLTQQDLVPNSDVFGSWNMRLMIQFADQLVETTPMLERYYGEGFRIHKGGTEPLRAVWLLNTSDWGARAWSQDWSAEPAASSTDGGLYFPITNDWTDPNNPNQVINYHHKHMCESPVTGVTQILVEEWDGYCWRRAFGNGPQPGREVKNVVITDTLPNNVNWGGFVGTAGTYSGNNISWNIGDMLVDQCGTVQYWVTAKDPGCMTADTFIDNRAFIQGQGESPVSSANRVTITCNVIPTATPAPASITKTADAATYDINQAITYTINYRNTYGSIIDSPLNAADAANWSNKGTGAAMNVTGGTITNVSNNNTCMTYNYARGINGTVTARVNVSNNTVFGIALRHLAAAGHANGVYVTFKTNPPNPGEVRFWNGTTEISAMQGLPGNLGNLFDVKIVLQGGSMMVYLKKTTDPSFPVTPTFPTVTGLPIQEGFAGVINGSPSNSDTWGTNNCSMFHSELDTSINTLIYDPLPPCVTFVGGDNTVTLNTATNPHQVEWPFIPLLTYNSAVTYKWWGKVNCSCQNITNTVYAVPTGISLTIADGMVVGVNCGATTPTFTPTCTPTATVSFTNTSTSTFTMTKTNTPSSTLSNTATLTQTLSGTVTVSVSATPTYTYTNTPSSTNTKTGTPTQTVTDTLSSNTPTFTLTSTNSYTASPTLTATNSMTASPTYSFTATATSTGTDTGTQTLTQTSTSTVTVTGTDIIFTRTITPTWINTFTYTATPTQSGTGTNTSTSTATKTYTATPTQSGTGTDSPTYTATGTFTKTLTVTNTRTQTATPTMTGTWTNTATATGTPMPSPVTLDITLTTSGDVPAVGALITYTIRIVNNTPYSVDHVAIWDTLPQDMVFENEIIGPEPGRTGNYMSWDLSGEWLGSAAIKGELEPNGEITIEFTARIKTIDPSRLPMSNTAMTDYNDPYYTTTIGKHPPLESETSFYPIGKPVVFPNPFNLDTNKVVIFDNVVPGSMIQMYTLSGERVKAIYSAGIRATWDCKNTNNKVISPGIYYFVITNQSSGQVRKGKIFVVRGN